MTFRILSFAAIVLVGAASSALAQSATQTRLLSLQNPSAAGAPVRLRAEVDGLGGAPTGWLTFWDGTTRVGVGQLVSPTGAGQETIDSGSFHSCALTVAGGVKCWGANSSGQIGDGTTTDRYRAIPVTGLSSGVVAIAGSPPEPNGAHSCALTGAGGAKCWGENWMGQLGDGTSTDRLTPVAVSGLTSGVVAIATGDLHSCALTSAGGVKCWGYNYYGQLGDGTEIDAYSPVSGSYTPVAVSGLSNGVVAISAGQYFACALTGAGGVKCWGWNFYGELGDGTTGFKQTTPVDTQNVTGLVRARAEFTTPPLTYGPHWLRAYYRGDATHAPSLGGVRQWVQ